jgi:hypothetical protein
MAVYGAMRSARAMIVRRGGEAWKSGQQLAERAWKVRGGRVLSWIVGAE